MGMNSPSITLRPQIELLGLDLRVQLRQTTKESLQDFPSGLSSKVRGV